MPFYLTPEQDDYNKIPEIQACIAEALYILGVDGCKGGWIAIRKDIGSGEISSEVHSSGEQLINPSTTPDVLALDIPIGLTDSGPRQCDILARKMLGQPRGRSVFPAPIRPALAATDRQKADAITQSVDRKGVSAQAFGLYPRIREIDEIMRNDKRACGYVHEVHPELCFMAWNDGEPILESKKSYQGMSIRWGLVRSHFGGGVVGSVRQRYGASVVADDDIYDAFAALWTAERIHLEIAKVIPDPPEIDSFGIQMGMSY